jgi:hypothetical protein
VKSSGSDKRNPSECKKRPFEYVKTIEIENERDCAIFVEGKIDN